MAKARVHEVAKELGLSSKDVLAHLEKIGHPAKTASSGIDEAVAQQLRSDLGNGAAAPAETAKAKPAKAAPAAKATKAPAPAKSKAKPAAKPAAEAKPAAKAPAKPKPVEKKPAAAPPTQEPVAAAPEPEEPAAEVDVTTAEETAPQETPAG